MSGQNKIKLSEMVAIYCEHRATFSKRVINDAVETLKVIAEPNGQASGDLLPLRQWCA
ncbi:hypothetical protein ACLB1Q_33235 [Escherichia coli]